VNMCYSFCRAEPQPGNICAVLDAAAVHSDSKWLEEYQLLIVGATA